MQALVPPTVSVKTLIPTVADKGYGLLSAHSVAEWAGCSLDALHELSADWNHMPPDNYLKDGGRYRRRRHSSFVFEHNALQPVPHRAHWQSLDYNALHGGMERWFEPMQAHTVTTPTWTQLLTALAHTFTPLPAVKTPPANVPPVLSMITFLPVMAVEVTELGTPS